ncbi:ribokinase [Halpernia frigidisoli]|uniref:Ribokinase n=1 Tax=Halpernia frigidisoli TaxID=1125876 RepID=A0A1I3FPR1_9FLAO|nr:ribokinase [Halpernia frigidisoli]SFI13223.1 ribokinase [Halpernia frigidisoli]
MDFRSINFNENFSPKIVVVGSCSIDLVLNTSKMPQANETVLADQSQSFFGGKGANQAVATSRLGASVYFVGAVGADPHGQQILRNLRDENINIGFVAEKSQSSTGTAFVTAAEGKNAIVVVPAANNLLSPMDIEAADKAISQADLVLTQLEIPLEAVEYLYKKCEKHNVKIALYASPAKKLSQKIIDQSEFILAKTADLAEIFGPESREQIMKRLPNKLFVRDDTNSTIYFNGTEMSYYRNDPAQTAHKMGMGDAFTSGFAIAYCHKNEIKNCVKFGNDISLKVAENRGSQSGLPYLKNELV